MNKVAQYYRELVTSLSERLRNGERDIDALVDRARQRVMQTGELTRTEVEELTWPSDAILKSSRSVMRRVSMRRLTVSLCGSSKRVSGRSWRILPIKPSLNGAKYSRPESSRVYHSGEVVGLGNLVCEKCHFHLAVYTPDVLPLCPKCGHDQFQRRPFEP